MGFLGFLRSAIAVGIGMYVGTTTVDNATGYPEYHFNNTVRGGSGHVRFDESYWTSRSHLHVTKPDGRKIEYILREGKDHTLTLDEVVARDGSRETRYRATSKNADISGVVEKARPEAAAYLNSIVEEKVQQYR